MTDKRPTVLVCVLDWGLGHASRMIPVIRELIRSGYNVLLGGSGKSLALLKYEFPSLQQVTLPALTIQYSGSNNQIFKLIMQLPNMISTFMKEHNRLKKLLTEHTLDIVISDNRYGMFHRDIYSILVTHQIAPVLPRIMQNLEYPLYRILRMLISRFSECWIPDYSGHQINLTGKLSHRFSLPPNARFIGILSRFAGKKPAIQFQPAQRYKLVIVLSGPEPQRSILFDLLWNQVPSITIKTLIICGFTRSQPVSLPGYDHISCVSHLSTDVFHSTLYHAGLVICRAGYSSIMDLVALKKTAILIPTPGQTEQEYLARYLSENDSFTTISQKDFNLKRAVEEFEKKNRPSSSPGLLYDHEQLSFLISSLTKKYNHYAYKTHQKS